MGQEWIRNRTRLPEMGQEWIKMGQDYHKRDKWKPYYQIWSRIKIKMIFPKCRLYTRHRDAMNAHTNNNNRFFGTILDYLDLFLIRF